MTKKWRPSLAFVLGGALCGTLGMSLMGLIAYRYLGPVMGFGEAAILLAVLIAIATASLGWLLVRLLLRPIKDLQRFSTHARIALNNAVAPPKHFGTRELQATAMSVTEMAETLRNRETTIRSFSDHVSHELKSPVAVIRAASELLQESEAHSQSDLVLIEQIAGASDQMEQQLQAMRAVVQAREVQYAGSTNVDSVVSGLAPKFPDMAFDVSGGDVLVPIGTQGLEIVLGHLVTNSAAHVATAVTITATAQAERVSLKVCDNGTGISQGNADRIFDPFFTTRRIEGGTGMGLSIVQSLLRAHGASIKHVARGVGTAFEITF